MTEEAIDHIGRRRDSRLRVEVPARLILLSGHLNASLCDLSQSGARFRVAEPIKNGQEGVFTWLEFETFGRIVWARNDFAGMEFDEPLAPQVLFKTRDRMDHGEVVSEKQQTYQKSHAWFTGYQ